MSRARTVARRFRSCLGPEARRAPGPRARRPPRPASRPPPPGPPAGLAGARSAGRPPRGCRTSGPGSRCGGWRSPRRWPRPGRAPSPAPPPPTGVRSVAATITKRPGRRARDGRVGRPAQVQLDAAEHVVEVGGALAQVGVGQLARTARGAGRTPCAAPTRRSRAPRGSRPRARSRSSGSSSISRWASKMYAWGAADLPGEALLDGLELLPRGLHRPLEPLHLRVHGLRRHQQAEDGHRLPLHDQGRPHGDARRDADAARGSRRPPRSRPPPGRPGPPPPSASSSPRRTSSRRVPWEAARSRMPRMDLPSMAAAVAAQRDAGAEAVGGVHEARRGAGVQPQPVHDAHLAQDQGVFFSRISLAT